ncbi:MAG: PAS domain S-box protein [Pseudomonadota bacterium]
MGVPTGDIQVVQEVLRPPGPLEQEPTSGAQAGRSPILGSYLGSYEEGVAVVAPDGRLRLFTPGLERITGFSAHDLPSIEDAVRLLAPDEKSVRGFSEFLDAALGVRESGERLVRIRNRAGHERWLRASVHRVNEDALIHVLDITAVHRVEPPQPVGVDPWRMVLEDHDLGLWAMDDPDTGQVTWANRVARDILRLGPRWEGAPLDEFLSLADPTDRVRFLHALQADRFTQARTVQMVTRLVRPGTRGTVSAQFTATAAYDPQGRAVRVVGTVRDLGMQRSTETRRLRAELLLRSLFEHVATGVVVGTLDGVFLAANPAFCEMIGYREQELLGRHVDDVVHPDDHGSSDSAREAAIAGGLPTVRLARRYLHRDGHVVTCETTLVAVHDDQGRPVAGIAMVLPTGTA